MARRSRRQLDLPAPKTWGGARVGAGRKPAPGRPRIEARPPRNSRSALSSIADPSRCLRRVIPAFDRSLRGRSGGDRADRRSHLSSAPFLGPTRPRSRNRGGRQPRRAQKRTPRPGHPDGSRDQTRHWQRKGLGRPLPRAAADDAARGSTRNRLRPSEFSKASARTGWHRSPELRTVVRWVEVPCPCAKRSQPDLLSANLACCNRMAPTGPDRPSGSAETVNRILAPINGRGFKMARHSHRRISYPGCVRVAP